MHTAKIFRKGGYQAVRLPKEFSFDGSEVFIKRVGRAVVLMPKDAGWNDFWASLDQFPGDFMAEREQLPLQDRKSQ